MTLFGLRVFKADKSWAPRASRGRVGIQRIDAPELTRRYHNRYPLKGSFKDLGFGVYGARPK